MIMIMSMTADDLDIRHVQFDEWLTSNPDKLLIATAFLDDEDIEMALSLGAARIRYKKLNIIYLNTRDFQSFSDKCPLAVDLEGRVVFMG